MKDDKLKEIDRKEFAAALMSAKMKGIDVELIHNKDGTTRLRVNRDQLLHDPNAKQLKELLNGIY